MARTLRIVFVIAIALGVLANRTTSSNRTLAAAPSLHFLYGSGSQTGGKRITLRIEMTGNAPQGGINVSLSSSDGAVAVPNSIHIPTGASSKTFTVATSPVTQDRKVTISASYGGVSKSHSTLIKAPILTSLSVQSVIRHGGAGRVTVRLSGPAPMGGIAVHMTVNPTGYLTVPKVITILAGHTQASIAASASLLGAATDRMPDRVITASASAKGVTKTATTIIRDYGNNPRPTATSTIPVTSTPTFTPTSTPTESETETPVETHTAEPTSSPTSQATDSPSPTPTIVVDPPARSSACQALNTGSLDATLTSGDGFNILGQLAGETVTITAGEPSDGGPISIYMSFRGNSYVTPEVIVNAGYPSTISYTFTADDQAQLGGRIEWGALNAQAQYVDASWQVSCQ